MIKSFEIGTLPFAYASADPSLPPSTCVEPTFDEPTFFFPSREIKRCLADKHA